MSEYTPTTGQVRQFWASEGTHVPAAKSEDYVVSAAEFDRWLDRERAIARREGQAEGMRSTASWLEGGTPRAYGFQHPCDPPYMRTQPTERELRLMYAVDAIREAADRIENGESQ